MSDYVPFDILPYELVVEILARLPVISLLRYKSVCKSWYSLITSPSFVTKHLNHCKNKLLMRIYPTDDDHRERYHIFRDDVRWGDECSKQKFPYRGPFGHVRIVGSCNGLLCMCEDFYTAKSAIIVWNPSIGKSITLPKPQVGYLSFLGFGAHPTTNEYKVVRILYQKNPNQHKKLVELYTQGTTSWRGLGSSFPPNCLIQCDASQAFVNGAVNWIAEDSSGLVGYLPLILSFNMSAETFAVMMLPSPLVDQKLASLSVHLFQESLAVSCGQQRGKGNMAYWIWVMKEYGVSGSWTKLISFEINHPLLLDRPLGVLGNSKVLLSKIDDPLNPISDHQLLSYDTVTKAVTDTKIRGFRLRGDPFMETLFSV